MVMCLWHLPSLEKLPSLVAQVWCPASACYVAPPNPAIINETLCSSVLHGIKVHKLWSTHAGQLPNRTDEDAQSHLPCHQQQ